jgi:hypothetical protein
LIDEIGIEAVEKLEFGRHVQVKWSRGDLMNMIATFKEKIKELKNIS